MKKTLAAVLAAAMALSTATVAFAADTFSDSVTLNGEKIGTEVEDDDVDINTNIDLYPTLTTEDGTSLTNGDLYTLLKNNMIKAAVTVTEGKTKFATLPNVSTVTSSGVGYARLRYKIAHDYGTSDIDIGFRVKFTVLKNVYMTETTDDDGNTTRTFSTSSSDGSLLLTKGDTYISADYSATAAYDQVDYYSEITITEEECDNGQSLAKGEYLYDAADEDGIVAIYFDDVAVFESKISSAQKNINLFYTTEEYTDIQDAYPDVDFEFITFKGTPTFTNSGTMTFNAIGGRSTTVYTFDGETLTPLTSTYDSTYGTISVKGIRKLGTFVVASEVLEVEEEEEEPVASSEPVQAPVVEEEDSNPNTGAC